MTDAKQALQRLDAEVPQQQYQTMALDAVGRKAAIDELLNKVALVQEVMSRVMKDGEHYGKIPGCGDKPALLKAGAEKLGMTFRIRPQFQIDERDLGRGHREYSIKCILSDGTEGVGSCSTMESKYRYRGGERKCPECGKATIIKGKAEYGGGWLCFAKKGGCGAKFAENDLSITEQQVGKVEHDNPADFYNTCLKMGKKRAHVDAIITATACSDIFTQDVEEMVGQADATKPESPSPAKTVTTPPPAKQEQKANTGEQIMPNVTVAMVHEKQGTKKDGTAWTAYFVLLDDGFARIEAATFSRTVSQMAKSLAESGAKAEAKIKPGNKQGSFELVSILPVIEPKETDDIPMDFEKGTPQPDLMP